MYCRVCGAQINNNAEICVKCGCRPLNGKRYCQMCGERTTEQQEMCVKCGCMLGRRTAKSDSILSGINVGGASTDTLNLDFSSLPPYWQQEFQKIYNSNETYKGKFNVCAFLFAAIWALTKGCWLSAVVALVLSAVTGGIAGFVYWFIFGFRGNYMYYCEYVKNKQCIF